MTWCMCAGHRTSLGTESCLLPLPEAGSLVLLCIFQAACPLTLEELGILLYTILLAGIRGPHHHLLALTLIIFCYFIQSWISH